MEKPLVSYAFFIGIDLSKTYFDATIVNDLGKKVTYKRFDNTSNGHFLFSSWVGTSTHNSSSLLFCMEHTGIYGRAIQHFLQDHHQFLWIESALQIKRSLGIQRGKNDRIDSFRIAIYAQEKSSKAQITHPYDTNIEQMHDLLTTRNRLLTAYNSLRTAQEEIKIFDFISYQTIKDAQKQALTGLQASIKVTEEEIDKLLQKNSTWQQNVELGTSIKGLGKITILWMLVYTRNFDLKFNARKIAALAGIAPYEFSSGTSVRAGTHVSKFAHAHLKAILHTAAMSAIRFNEPIKAYHKRKKQEGKKGLVVMNNIKNKLVHQLIAVVRSQKKFDPLFQHPKIAA